MASGSGRGRRSAAAVVGADPGDPLAEALATVARTLHGETRSLERTLQGITAAAVESVPGAEDASITEVRHRQEVSVRTATSEVAQRADLLQYRLQQGPCLDSAYVHETVRACDLRHEERWPAFCAAAAELGLRSLLAIQLYVEDDDLGALNLYSTEPYAFDDESEHVGLLFASHAAIAMASATHDRQLQRALGTRDVIGQAKGILMERYQVDADTAFQVLVRASQDGNHKLVDIAHQLASTGRLHRADG